MADRAAKRRRLSVNEVLMELDDDDEREPITIGIDDEFEDITYI